MSNVSQKQRKTKGPNCGPDNSNTGKLCEVTGVSKSSFYYNRNNDSQKLKDTEVLKDLKQLPEKIVKRRGSKVKSKELKLASE